MAGDVDERWLALNPLPLRKKDKSYKDVDERWMRMRNTRFVDVIQERLKAHPDGKVLLLVGSAHAALIGKIARERGVQARVIDVSERNFGKSYATRVLEGEDQTLDALAALEALDQSLDRELARLANTECWPKDRAERPWDVQKRLLAAQERAAVLAGPGGPHAARPLEIVIREVERLKQDFPAQVAEAERLAREGPPRGSFADFWNGMDASTADRLQKFARKVAQHAAIVRDQVQQAVPELAENAWTPVAQTEGIDISLRQIERSGRAVVQERVTRAGSSPKEVTLPDLDICSPA
jgi:predicted outer membrane protein